MGGNHRETFDPSTPRPTRILDCGLDHRFDRMLERWFLDGIDESILEIGTRTDVDR